MKAFHCKFSIEVLIIVKEEFKCGANYVRVASLLKSVPRSFVQNWAEVQTRHCFKLRDVADIRAISFGSFLRKYINIIYIQFINRLQFYTFYISMKRLLLFWIVCRRCKSWIACVLSWIQGEFNFNHRK